jgi:hypothetical protein
MKRELGADRIELLKKPQKSTTQYNDIMKNKQKRLVNYTNQNRTGNNEVWLQPRQ